MKRRECASLIILALAAVPALLVAIGQVYVTGVDGIRLRRTETIDLLTEIAVLFFLYLFTIWKIESNRIRTGAVLLITAGFLWIHQAFTAMILSGTYVLVLLMLGARIRRGMDRDHRAGGLPSWKWIYDMPVLPGIPVFRMWDHKLPVSHSGHRWTSGWVPDDGIEGGGR